MSESIREKVLEAAESMGYAPPNCRGIQDYLNEHGFLSLIANWDWDPSEAQ